MHSPFTFNPNAHRASNYQQQSGRQQPVYNIGVPYAGLMSHPSQTMNHHPFARSFASVVKCENDLGKFQNINKANNCHNTNNMGIINTFMSHFNRPQSGKGQPQHKEFEDFTHMPSLPGHNYNNNIPNHPPPPQHFYQQPQPHHINVRIPIISGQFYPQSAQVPSANETNNPTTATRNFMASFFGGYQQRQQQPQTNAKQRKWFGRGFRCGRGGGNRWRSQKFHENDVNLQKNIHEKERKFIERDIQDDICDFVHVEDNDVLEKEACDIKIPNETAKGSDDPPFTKGLPAVAIVKPPLPAKPVEEEKSEEGFVVFPPEAANSTPVHIPRRLKLCERIELMLKSSPSKILKPCLKPSRRRVSECSDDWIQFTCDDGEPMETEDEAPDSDDYSETDSDDDEDDVDGMDDICEEKEMSDIEEDDSEDEEVDDDDECSPELQLDSGVEERRVRFNMTPKVHVMRVWECAYRLSRKGDYWQQIGRDTLRFKNRIKSLESVLDPVLSTNHRRRVYHERFEDAI